MREKQIYLKTRAHKDYDWSTQRFCQFFAAGHIAKGQKFSKANYLDLTCSKKRTKYLPNSAPWSFQLLLCSPSTTGLALRLLLLCHNSDDLFTAFILKIEAIRLLLNCHTIFCGRSHKNFVLIRLDHVYSVSVLKLKQPWPISPLIDHVQYSERYV